MRHVKAHSQMSFGQYSSTQNPKVEDNEMPDAAYSGEFKAKAGYAAIILRDEDEDQNENELIPQ